ncbi:putative gag-pol polyprotein, partial [Trifolium medium]|nr:putative gag-pol polyprotein [Trifolium medium]
MKVNFTKSECLVTNDKDEVLMKGVRSKDNCYLWVPQESTYSSTCLMTKEDEVKLWHQKLGHLNLKGMKRIISKEAIRGLPKLKIEEGNVCGECQIGKQTKMSHPKLQHLTTSKVLELLHMDLMEPMQVEGFGGKRYVFVVVDDFSRFTWVNFIKEELATFYVFKYLCQRLQREKENVIVRIRSDHGRTKVMMESINVVIDDSSVDRVTNVEEDVGTSLQQTDVTEDVIDKESNIESGGIDYEDSQANKG